MRRFSIPAILLSSLLASSSCSKNTILAIAVGAIPLNSKTLQFNARIADKKYTVSEFNISNVASQIISVEIPSDVPAGLTNIDIIATDTDHRQPPNPNKPECATARWSGSVAVIEPATYSISAQLQLATDDPIDQDLFTVKSISRDDVWAAGSNRFMAHWDGCFWKKSKFDDIVEFPQQTDELPGDLIIFRIINNPKIGLWAVGSSGLIFNYNQSKGKWKAYTQPRQLFTAPTGTGISPISLSEWYTNMYWLDLAYIEGTNGEFLIVGSNAHPYASPSYSNAYCMVVKATPIPSQPGEYSFSQIANACNTTMAWDIPSVPAPALPPPPPIIPQPVLSNCKNCFYPNRIGAFSDGLIIAGVVKLADSAKTAEFPYGAYVKYPTANTFTTPTARYVLPKWTNNNQDRYGSSFVVWGANASDFWMGNNRLYHIGPGETATPFQSYPEYITNIYEDKGPFGYRFTEIVGFNKNDFWALVLSGKSSSAHHFTTDITKTTSILSKDIDQIRFKVPVENFNYTSIDGISSTDIWFVGYGGVRVHYDGKTTVVHR